MNYKKGFTLIELLVVIAIIGILSVIVLAAMSNSRRNARDAQRISDMKQIETALELYAGSNAFIYPANIYTGNPLGPYISSLPVDPGTGANYNYIGLSPDFVNCTGFHLGAVLENGNNAVLTSQKDSDYNSSGLGPTERCNAGAGLRFNGAAATVYDIKK